jgi:threonine dehydratase
MTIVRTDTPWEAYPCGANEVEVYVKREDLCTHEPGPMFSKVRGVEERLRKLKAEGVTEIGVLDTFHSKAGWGVSWICNLLSLKCYNFYPVYKADTGLREQQEISSGLGAVMMPLKAGRSSILYHQAKKQLAEVTDGKGYMMPNALKLEESVEATAVEVVEHTPLNLHQGTWIISISSGTLAAGVIRGLCRLGLKDKVTAILHLGYSRSDLAVVKYIYRTAGCWVEDTYLMDEGFEYKDKVSNEGIPFPCNPYYDAKAWRWLEAYGCEWFTEPIVFWNIGA